MTFLTPLFLLGLAALAIPVLIHLTQRERTTVVEFPSLMFLKKIPYESVKRRRLRDLLLLALRAAALALIVAAFARPFLRGPLKSRSVEGETRVAEAFRKNARLFVERMERQPILPGLERLGSDQRRKLRYRRRVIGLEFPSRS